MVAAKVLRATNVIGNQVMSVDDRVQDVSRIMTSTDVRLYHIKRSLSP